MPTIILVPNSKPTWTRSQLMDFSGFKIAASCRWQPALWPHLLVIFHHRNRKKWDALRWDALEQVHLHLHKYLKRIGWHFESFLNCKTLSIIVLILVNHLFVLATISICWHYLFQHGIIRVQWLNLIEEWARHGIAVPQQFSSLLETEQIFNHNFLCYHWVFDSAPLSTLSLFWGLSPYHPIVLFAGDRSKHQVFHCGGIRFFHKGLIQFDKQTGFDFFFQLKSIFAPERALKFYDLSFWKKKLWCYQIIFRTQCISGSVFLQQTFEEIVNLYKILLTLQLKTVQKPGTLVKELVNTGNILFQCSSSCYAMWDKKVLKMVFLHMLLIHSSWQPAKNQPWEKKPSISG